MKSRGNLPAWENKARKRAYFFASLLKEKGKHSMTFYCCRRIKRGEQRGLSADWEREVHTTPRIVHDSARGGLAERFLSLLLFVEISMFIHLKGKRRWNFKFRVKESNNFLKYLSFSYSFVIDLQYVKAKLTSHLTSL